MYPTSAFIFSFNFNVRLSSCILSCTTSFVICILYLIMYHLFCYLYPVSSSATMGGGLTEFHPPPPLDQFFFGSSRIISYRISNYFLVST